MARTLGTLTVLIGASTALFQRELEKSQKLTKRWSRSVRGGIGGALAKVDNDLDRFAKQAEKAFTSPLASLNKFVNSIKVVGPALKLAAVGAGAFAASFGAVVGVGVIAGRTFRELSEELQFTADTADRLGVSFEFLQGLGQAAASFGVDMGRVNDNLRQFTTFLTSAKLAADAGSETTTQFGQALESIGLSVDGLFALSPEKRFIAVVDSLSQLEDQTTKSGIAVRLFGESGRDLVDLAEDSERSLGDLVEEFADFGAQLSGPQLAAIEGARTSLFQLGLAFEGVQQQALAAIAPVIQTLAEFVLQVDFTTETSQRAFDFLAAGVARAYDLIDSSIMVNIGIMTVYVGAVQTAFGAAVEFIGKAAGAIESTINALGNTMVATANAIVGTFTQILNAGINAINGFIAQANNLPGANFSQIGNISTPSINRTFNSQFLGSGRIEQFGRANRIGGVSRIASADFGGSDFFDRFQENRDQGRLNVPAPPPGGIGNLPPPPGGGGGGGGGRSGGRGSSAAANKNLRDKERATRDLEKAFIAARKALAELNSTFTDDLTNIRASNEAEEFRLQLLEQGAMRVDEQVKRFEELRDARNSFAQAEQELEKLLMEGLITQGQFADAIANVTQEFESLENAFTQSDALAQAQDRTLAIAELTESLNERLRDQLGINERLTEVERLRLEIRSLDVELTDKQITSLEKLAAVVDLTAERTKNLEAQYSLLEQTSNILIDAGSNLFQSLIRGTGSLSDRLGSFFNNLFDNLLQLSVNTIFQSLLGGGGGGGGGFLGGIFGGLLGFQSGGIIPHDGVFQLHSGERVLNRAEAARMSQGEGGRIVINNFSSAQVSARQGSNGDREIIIRDAVNQARQAVQNDFTRSVSSGYGTYSDGIQGSYIVRRKI